MRMALQYHPHYFLSAVSYYFERLWKDPESKAFLTIPDNFGYREI